MKLHNQIILESTTAYYDSPTVNTSADIMSWSCYINPNESVHVSALFTYSTQGRKRGKKNAAFFTTRFFISVLCLLIHYAAQLCMYLCLLGILTYRRSHTDSGRTGRCTEQHLQHLQWHSPRHARYKRGSGDSAAQQQTHFQQNPSVRPTDHNQLEARRQHIINHYKTNIGYCSAQASTLSNADLSC